MKLVAVIAAVALAATPHPMRNALDAVASYLVELARRAPPEDRTDEQRERALATAKLLRSTFASHPKQRAYYRSKAKLKATRKTRRAGATAGGVRELLARSLEVAGHRATYVTTTRIEARERAWENDTNSGFVQVIKKYGVIIPGPGVDMYDLGGVSVSIREQDLALEFSNGSRIDLFGADNLRAIGKKRGNAKHVFWIDEAQDFRFLDEFYGGVVVAALTDFDGECWLSGTPGRDCIGMFYEVTRGDGEEMSGWEVHEIAVVDNPYFGAIVWEDGKWFVVDNIGQQTGPYENEAAAEEAAIAIRWERTAGAAIRRNSWPPEHPDLIREWYARWLKTDTSHVYPVNAVPPTVKLVYAPMRTVANTFRPKDGEPAIKGRTGTIGRWYDHERSLLDLPRRSNGRMHDWLFAIGEDFGHFPDPFALVVWGFTFERPDVFEMFSWKATKVLPDDQREYTQLLWNAIGNIIVLVGDPAGREGELEAWRTRFNLPIENADKANKNVYQELMAGDIRAGNVHYREDSPLLFEHRHLLYLPSKPGKTRLEAKARKIAGGIVPGNHCSDAGLYAHRHLNHFLFREKPKDERDAAEKQGDEHEDRIDRVQEIKAALREQEQDLGYGEYEY